LTADQEGDRQRAEHLRGHSRPRPCRPQGGACCRYGARCGHAAKCDQEIIKLVISAASGCDCCVAAHNHLAKLAGVKPDVLKQIREGQPTGDAKRDALVGIVRKLAQSSGTVSDEDFVAIEAAGYSDAQLVEISLAFATTVFTNVFNRINDTEIDFPAIA
jgi:AhpD family alkylhydroperoxidase